MAHSFKHREFTPLPAEHQIFGRDYQVQGPRVTLFPPIQKSTGLAEEYEQ
jgi:hypothetical protein